MNHWISHRILRLLLGLILPLIPFFRPIETRAQAIGSKAFTESYILAEIASLWLEAHGFQVRRHLGMGGTGILYAAISSGQIDVYPEYTGTLVEAVLKDSSLRNDFGLIKSALLARGLSVSAPLGFNNSYALAVSKAFAKKHSLESISDLKRLGRQVTIAFSNEFMTRRDGFTALREHYDLEWTTNVRSLEHSLAFEAIADQKADLIDVYSTDAKIAKLGLVVLRDDQNFFPNYEAVFLARSEFAEKHPKAWGILQKLQGLIDEPTMIALNSKVDNDGLSFYQVAKDFLASLPPGAQSMAPKLNQNQGLITSEILLRVREHIFLVAISLTLSVLLGLPLGVLAAHQAWMGRSILTFSSIVQTIPSLALLCFLIPFFGIGVKPALIALTLYGLLPIVLNTLIGIQSIDPSLKETAKALGLNPWQRIMRIELPISSPMLLGGIRTSATIGIGTATLAALIGAGGLGAPIVTGLAINDTFTILTGAIPAALLALITQGVSALASRLIIPKGLKSGPST